jgi:anti-sigma regulatory factor (Ser/Thr protein kinase)
MPDMLRLSNSLTLAALPTAVKLSRTLVAVTLKYWGLGRMAEEAELVISELATNAVKATGIVDAEPSWSERANLAVIRVRIVYLETGHIVLEVWDGDPTPPKPTDAEPEADSGRGLAIVEALCARWDYFPAIDGGKVVWAELEIPPLPVTDADLPIRIPDPVQLGPIPPVINRDPRTLRRVRHGLKNLD